ncbi:hypothetical protein HDE_12323 [Halotydeus destructor]|nr:hypothetical protein HDE_12323 [Halotydeus destructor]
MMMVTHLRIGNSKTVESEESSSDEVDSDIDCDSTVNIDHLSHEDGIKLNSLSLKFGMKGEDFTRNLENDKVEAERLKLAKEIENEKSKFSGRKSRRDRKILNPKRMLIMRTTNNTSEEKIKKEESSSSSESEKESYVAPKIEFITSFGQSSNEEDTTVKEKVKESKPNKLKNLRRAINKDETQTKIEFGPSISSSSRRNKSRERDHVSHRPRTKTSHHESSGHQRRRKNSSSRSRSRDRSPRKNSQEKEHLTDIGQLDGTEAEVEVDTTEIEEVDLEA